MPKDSSKEDREARIESLRKQIEETAGEAVSFGSDDCPPELQEKFLESVLAFEHGDHPPLFDALVDGGMTLPSPDELGDAQLNKKLWEVIQGLSLLGVFLHNTDHLSDRELYEHLWHDSLREGSFIKPGNPNYACHLDVIGSGSEEDHLIYLRYFADEDERRDWASQYPRHEMPDHEEKPFDRDARLPKRETWGTG